MQTLTVTHKEEGQRLDKFLKKYLSFAPGSFIYKMLRKKNITLNRKKAGGSEIIQEGDVICFFLADDTMAKFRGRPGPKKTVRIPALDVLYEDEDVLFLNKAAGVLTQPGVNGHTSLASMLTPYLLREGKVREEDLRAFRPAPVNRLDRNTSGLILCGISLSGSRFLSEIIRNRDVRKTYLAVVWGNKVRTGVVKNWYIKEDTENMVHLYDSPKPGSQVMETAFEVIRRGEHACLVRCELITGKTHQIRSQLAHGGTPILGDPKYGDKKANDLLYRRTGIRRQLLHSYETTFPVIEGEFSRLSGKTFCAPLPTDFMRACHVLGLKTEKTAAYKGDRLYEK